MALAELCPLVLVPLATEMLKVLRTQSPNADALKRRRNFLMEASKPAPPVGFTPVFVHWPPE
jgi:hypothetical protein